MGSGKSDTIKTRTLDLVSAVLGLIMFVEWILLIHFHWENLFLRVLFFGVSCFTGLMIGIYLFRKPPSWAKGRKKRLYFHRLKKSYLFARKNFMYAFFLTLMVSIVWGNPSEKEVRKVEQEVSREEVFYDKLTLHERTLDSERKVFRRAWKKWDSMNDSRKKEVLERVIDVEATNLGLGYSVTLVIQDLDELIEGRYRDFEVQLQRKNFETDSFMKLVENISHEMYHSYQQREIDAYDASEQSVGKGKKFDEKTGDMSFLYSRERRQVIRQWKEEFEDYNDGTGGDDAIEQYYYQEVEVTARMYSERRAEEYRKAMVTVRR